MFPALTANDIESYPNYTLFGFKSVKTGQIWTVSLRGKNATLSDHQKKKLTKLLKDKYTFGFNSNNYDIPMQLLALKGHSAKQLFRAGNHIITHGLRDWQTFKLFDIRKPRWLNHFDLMEVAKGVMVNLKTYGARLHAKKVQDLPYAVGKKLTKHEMDETEKYCGNDLDTTILLYEACKQELELRVKMGEEYGLDLMSKSDAQIAETVIKSELMKLGLSKAQLKAPKLSADHTFRYRPPDYIKFKSPYMKRILKRIKKTKFTLSRTKTGKLTVDLPDTLTDWKGEHAEWYSKLSRDLKKKHEHNTVKIGDMCYKLGIGGLHSTEKAQTVMPKKKEVLIDKDVASYYPALILNCNVIPSQLGKPFLKVFSTIKDERLEAKHGAAEAKLSQKHKKASMLKTISDSLKIVLNGTFGKLGSMFSIMFSPKNMIMVTLTGQLSLLMLIEELEMKGFKVVSANTDGFVTLLKKKDEKTYHKICKRWERLTGLDLEDTYYDGLFSESVNSYIAVSSYYKDGDGKRVDLDEPYVKLKGNFRLTALDKNPDAEIVSKAVTAFITKGVPLAKTVNKSKDVKDFVIVRNAKGGGIWRDQFLGKVCRWVHVTDGDKITYAKSGNKVAGSDNCMPMMELKKKLPKTLDREWYLLKAERALRDLGVYKLDYSKV